MFPVELYQERMVQMENNVLKQVFANPNIDKAVTDFNNDWYAVYGEGKGICDL